MKIFQAINPDGDHIGLLTALPRTTTEDVENAHREYEQYRDNHDDSSDNECIDFEEWAKIYRPELGIQRIFADEVNLDASDL